MNDRFTEASSAHGYTRMTTRGRAGAARRIPILLTAAVLGLSAPAVGFSADPAAPAMIEEITVTASRMGEQSVQTVPMAISAISAESLERRDLTSFTDFVRTISSVNITQDSPGDNRIEMRGLVTGGINNTDSQDRSLVAVYVDDAPVTLNPFNPDLRVLDLERVEVLRGPQGTLYGAGSMAGTIRLITKRPTLTEVAGDVAVTGSHTQQGSGNYSARGSLSMPLVQDQLGVSLAVYRANDSGFIDNVNAALVSPEFVGHVGTGQRRANESTATQGRVALYWKPSNAFDAQLSAIDARLADYGTNNVYTQLGEYATTSVTPERFDDDFKLYNLALNYDSESGRLSSSTSYVDRHFDDQQSAAYEFLNQFLLGAPVFNPTRAQQINDVKDFTEELRWTSNRNQRLRYTAGVYYEHLTRHYLEDVYTKGLDAYFAQFIPGFNSVDFYGTPAQDTIFSGPIDITERQFAAFGEATVAITPRIDVTGGLRYYDFKQDFNLFFTGLAGALDFNKPLTGAGIEKATGVNPRAVVSFKQVENVLWYAEAARGFRYGGVNEPVPKQFCDPQNEGLDLGPRTFGSDKLWNYSLGEKGTFGPMLLNVNAFFIDWRDAPIRVDLSCGYYYSANLGHIHSKGLEWETRWRVRPEWTVGFSGTYTDARTVNDIAQISAVSGDRVPYFPKFIGSVSAEYGIPLAGGRLGVSADYTYRSSAFTQFDAAQQDRYGNVLQQKLPASRLLNAVIDFAFNQWQVGLFAKNLTNDLGVVNRRAHIYGPIEPDGQQSISRPRTVGVSLRYRF